MRVTHTDQRLYFRFFITKTEAKIFLNYLLLINNNNEILNAICNVELKSPFQENCFKKSGYPVNIEEKKIIDEFLKLDLL